MKSLSLVCLLSLCSATFAQTEVLAEVIIPHTEDSTKQKKDTVVSYFLSKNISFDSCTYRPIYDLAFEWLHVPYRYAGSTKKGIDCSGLVKHFYNNLYGIKLLGGSRNIFPLVKVVDNDKLETGDLVFFKIRGDRISHVGIYLKDGYFVHASTKLGVTVSNLEEEYYKTRFYKGGIVCVPNQ